MALQEEAAFEFTRAKLETAIDFAKLARLAAESGEEAEAQHFIEEACGTYEEAVDSLEMAKVSADQWVVVRPLMERFNSLIRNT